MNNGEERHEDEWMGRLKTELPRSIEPDRDLWPGIAGRLAPRRRSPARWAALLAAAAVVAVVAGVVVMERAAKPTETRRGVVAVEPVQEVDAVFASAKTTLLEALEARRPDLAPETLAVVEENLGIIDAAIVEIREAMENDPGNASLREMLVAAQEKEIGLLRRVIEL